MLVTDVIVEEAWPAAGDWQNLASKVLSAVLRRDWPVILDSPVSCEISVCLTGNQAVHALNAEYRGKDKPTNILSFPQQSREETAAMLQFMPEIILGDLVLAHDVCVAEAAERGITLPEHVTHLMVHGTLHLAGHDHLTDHEADAMEALETEIMKTLGYDDPYRHDQYLTDG